MALPAKKRKQRDPNDPTQILRTKKGLVRVAGRFWMVGGANEVPRIIVPTPEGGYRYARGGPIRSEKDLLLIEPKADRDKALEWWANKDKWQDTAPRKIAFEQGTGYPIFEDTGEYVDDPAVLQAYWPEGPILFAAMHALGNRLDAKVVQPVALQVVHGEAPVPQMEPLEAGIPVPETAPDQPAEAAKATPAPKKGVGKPWSKSTLKARREKAAKERAEKAAEAARAATASAAPAE